MNIIEVRKKFLFWNKFDPVLFLCSLHPLFIRSFIALSLWGSWNFCDFFLQWKVSSRLCCRFSPLVALQPHNLLIKTKFSNLNCPSKYPRPEPREILQCFSCSRAFKIDWIWRLLLQNVISLRDCLFRRNYFCDFADVGIFYAVLKSIRVKQFAEQRNPLCLPPFPLTASMHST